MVGFGCVYLDQNISEQKQACKKHELYVSFRELGWQVGDMHQRNGDEQKFGIFYDYQ